METLNTTIKKVLVGFSGGVDSAVSTLLLKKAGYDVTAYYFNVLENNEKSFLETKNIADQLNVPLIHDDLIKEFSNVVIEPFINEYIQGRTPNPCINCNPNFKFKKLIEVADQNNIPYIATGHYAKITELNGIKHIAIANNINKDQSYMLYRLPKSIIDRLILPLSDYFDKDDIRDIAKLFSLENANKKDSQEICFTNNYVDYILNKGYKSKAGDFIDTNGNVIGKHKGILNYTIGQRKGLGGTFGKPMFVLKIDNKNCNVTLGNNEDLFSNEVISINNCFIENPLKYVGIPLKAKVRYSAKLDTCSFEIKNNEIITHFDNPQRAITPGQSIVFYFNNIVIGGGIIK